MNALSSLRYAALLTTVSLITAASHAQTSTWKIDPVHSGVEFRIAHLGVSHVSGSFSKVTGSVKLDEKDVTKSSVQSSIDVATVNTNEPKRDDHLKSPEFFNLAANPAITFRSTGLSKDGDKLKMTGDLTLAGVTKPVTLTVDGPAAPQKGMGGAVVSGFSATGTLSRKDFNFGQKYTAPMLGDEVTFTIDIEMDKQ